MKREVKFRLIKHITFLEKELEDYKIFQNLSWKEYSEERSKRRDVERWIENIINSSIDIARIILTSEGKTPLADTYKDIVRSLLVVPGFDEALMNNLSEWTPLRNVISHEYLDIRWSSIKKFISETEPLYKNFLGQVKKYLERQLLAE
ncbi:MAG TPA: HepT-like ribonuclease domain-containing protein [Candidatus Brocadiales bacterium]|nr:HepT-like ribonuclease domain-containing protein [Candidatus Brocadiales bacterium]